MTATKTTVISVRVPPDIKAALSAAAEVERRSLATMVEVMVLDYCKARSIPLPAADSGTLGTAAPSRKKLNTSRKP
ncbi:MAG: hypothetical protein RL722_173 [Pseudomonadota bacterium]|jgi:predicted transcriptional regulator